MVCTWPIIKIRIGKTSNVKRSVILFRDNIIFFRIMFDPGSKQYMAYFVARGNRNGNVHVWDTSCVQENILRFFIPIGIDSSSPFSDYNFTTKFIDDFLNGKISKSDLNMYLSKVCYKIESRLGLR